MHVLRSHCLKSSRRLAQLRFSRALDGHASRLCLLFASLSAEHQTDDHDRHCPDHVVP